MPQATVNVSQLAKNPERAAPGSVIVQNDKYSYTPVGARQRGPWTMLTHVQYLIVVAPGTIVELLLHGGQYKPAVSGHPAVLQPIGSSKISFQGVLWEVARFRAGSAGSSEITADAPPCNSLVACTPDYRVVIRVQPNRS